MDNNTIKSNAIASLYNVDISYDFYGNPVSFKHIEIIPNGTLAEAIQVTLTGTVSKVAWDEPVATMKPIHQTTVPRGYKKVGLKKADGQWFELGVHRLVHFADNGEWSDKSEGSVIHHIDSNPANNHANNLVLTTSSANVLRFFRGLDNQEFIEAQEYKTDRINQGTVPLVHRGQLIDGYRINTMGQVTRKNKQGEWVQINPRHASKKYRMNLVLKVADKSASLHNLMAENFLVTPEGKYKTLMIDPAIANPYQPQNLYTVAKKHQ